MEHSAPQETSIYKTAQDGREVATGATKVPTTSSLERDVRHLFDVNMGDSTVDLFGIRRLTREVIGHVDVATVSNLSKRLDEHMEGFRNCL